MTHNLIFDFGKVLVDYDYMVIINQLFDDEVRKADFCKNIITSYWVDLLDKEAKPFAENIRTIQNSYPQYRSELQQMGERYAEFVTGEVPGMRNLLTRLKTEGFRLYGLSNWCSPVYEVMRDYEDIFSLLEGRIISCEEHVLKPDVNIYQRLCNRFSLKPEECVFTDDKAENVEAALRFGMKTILFKDACQYESELRTILAS